MILYNTVGEKSNLFSIQKVSTGTIVCYFKKLKAMGTAALKQP